MERVKINQGCILYFHLQETLPAGNLWEFAAKPLREGNPIVFAS